MKLALACLLLLIMTLPALAVDLPLKASVRVGGNQVLLRDLLSQTDAARLDQLSGPIRLFRAPEPGMTRKVSRQTLARLVGRQVKTEQLRLTGARTVSILRQGIWIDPEEMEAALEDFLASAARRLPGIEMSFEKIYLPARFMVAAGKIEHQVIPSEPQVIGSRRMTLITRVDDQVVSNQSIRVVIKARAQVVVVATGLRRGTHLSMSDLLLQQRDISKLEEPFFSFKQLLGKKIKQAVHPGEPLQRHQVEFPPLIKRGKRVTIQIRSRGLLLTASGEARQSGELGETIRVRNNRSQREIPCRVLSPDLVSVEL